MHSTLISYDTALLAKKAGYNETSRFYYDEDDPRYVNVVAFSMRFNDADRPLVTATTFDSLCSWLQRNYGITISIVEAAGTDWRFNMRGTHSELTGVYSSRAQAYDMALRLALCEVVPDDL